MKVREYCRKEVVVAKGTTPIVEAAGLMRQFNVGTIVIAEERGGGNEPTGIVTDRDLVLEVVATGASPDALTLADLPTRELVSVRGGDDLMTAIEGMRSLGIRRVPVVDDGGLLEGLLAMDDVLPVLSEMMNNLVQLIAREVSVEAHDRP